jgi:hypothetical protein
MFISEEILDWSYYTDNQSGLSSEEEDTLVWRAHELWRHATSLIKTDCSEFARSDSISNLKRAVNHRLQTLSQAYSFDALPFSNRKQTLEKFQFYGIIRPALLKEIFEVRNAIEHQDDTPPGEENCRRYADLVWYFLKSTDSLLLMKPDDVHFWSDDEKNSLVFWPKFDGSWNITVEGEISSEFILESGRLGAIELDESYERPSYICSPVYGKWNPTPEQLTNFARKYFGLSGYWWEDHA